MKCFALAAAMLWAGWAEAQTPAEAARAALAQLEEAADALEAAQGGRHRVRALTQTVQGYEAGLAALRDGLRAVALQEAQLSADLAAQEAEIAQILGALQTITRASAPARLTHPQGPAGTVRAGMLAAEITPALHSEAARLRTQLQDLHVLQSLQEQALATLQDGLAGAQDARAALSEAIADREDLPQRFIEDPIQTAVLVAATDTMESFAAALAVVGKEDGIIPLPSIADQKGHLPLPVQGQVLRAAGAADAAGVKRPGLLVATRGSALVTTPVPGTIRYVGPLFNFGLVTILEPQAETLFIFAGMGQVFGEIGQVLPAGDPVGLMAGQTEPASHLSDGGGNTRSETLYIEVRENGRTVDPESWFNTGRE